MYFSKSKYCEFCQCCKILWLKKNKPEELVIDESAESRFTAGNEVGDLAMGYFGDYVEVTAYREDGNLDIAKMIENTKAEMVKHTPVICEASFDFGGLYCAVDILRREGDGWSIYEVKSSTSADKDVYMLDVAYQKYVIELCGINVTGTYIMCLDNSYVYNGTLDIHKLFKVTDISAKVAKKLPDVDENLKSAEIILNSKIEPNIDIGPHCTSPYDCGFWNYCTRNLPKPNVFDLYNMKSRKFALYNSGIVTFEALEKEKSIENPIQKMQIDHYLHDKEPYVDKENLRGFLNGLTYPLYFLDFESVQPVVPIYVGTKPYAQIPFQYSLHYIEREGGELHHKEFLAEAGTDPRRALSESLCEEIPKAATVMVYNKTFECTRLKELAGYFPDLSEHLLNISAHVKDLVEPFRNGWYYNKRMGGSFSIKSVLPAIFPNDPSLDYHNLEGIHNGGEAMTAFPAMENMSPDELAKTRKNLLKYCELDTFAMVKVWQALKKAAKYD